MSPQQLGLRLVTRLGHQGVKKFSERGPNFWTMSCTFFLGVRKNLQGGLPPRLRACLDFFIVVHLSFWNWSFIHVFLPGCIILSYACNKLTRQLLAIFPPVHFLECPTVFIQRGATTQKVISAHSLRCGSCSCPDNNKAPCTRTGNCSRI